MAGLPTTGSLAQMRERLQRARDAEHAAFVEKTQGQLQESRDRAVHSSQAKISVDVVGRGSEGSTAEPARVEDGAKGRAEPAKSVDL